MKKPVYRLDEVAKTLLLALNKYGRNKTFAQILDEARISCSSESQAELANTLEALGVIESISYRLPFEIRAELTARGKELAERKSTKRKRSIAPPDHKTRPKGRD